MFRILFACVLVITADAADVTEDVVGGLTLNRLEIVTRDGPTFPPDEVANALREDPALVSATHFFAPRKALLTAISERCVLGYRANGFPTPQVVTGIQGRGAGERLVVTISEGPRMQWGTLHIRDSGPVAEAELRDRLCKPWRAPDAEPDATPEDPVFVSGDPAAFDPLWEKDLLKSIVDFYILQGYQQCRPVFTIGAPHDGVVDATIAFPSPPRAMVIDQLIVDGLKRNQTEAVTRWLESTAGLRVGGPATRDLINQARKHLVDCGRFTSATITTEPKPDRPEGVDVRVRVTDHARLPLLETPLTALQQDVLAWRERLLRDLAAGQLSMSVSVEEPTLKLLMTLTVNARRGFMVRITSRHAEFPLDLSIDVTDGVLTYHSHRSGRHASVALPQRPTIAVSLTTKDDPESPYSLGLNAGIASQSQGLVTIVIDPAFVLAQTMGAKQEGTRLNAPFPNGGSVQMDLAGDPPLVMKGTSDALAFECRLTRTSWVDLWSELSGRPWAKHPADSWLSVGMLMSEDMLPAVAISTKLDEAALRQWLTTGGLMLASWLPAKTDDEKKGPDYQIPVDLPPGQMIPLLIDKVGGILLSQTKDYWSPSSWPVLMINEIRAVANNRSERTRDMISHLIDGRNMGPIGHAVMARVLQELNPRMSQAVAGLGSDHLNADEWFRDISTLVPSMPHVQTFLASFTDPAGAAALLPEAHREAFVRLVDRAKGQLGAREQGDLYRDTAYLLWQAGGERHMRDLLKELAQPPAATGTP